MEDLDFAELDFAVGWCAICGKDVLTYAGDDGEAPEGCRCVHCEQVVAHRLRTAKGRELAAHGYGVLDPAGCGSPTCGSGRCGRGPHDA